MPQSFVGKGWAGSGLEVFFNTTFSPIFFYAIESKDLTSKEDLMQSVTVVNMSPWDPGFLSLAVYIFMVFFLMGVILFLTGWLGEKKKSLEKSRPYECGIIPTGSAHPRYPVPFYLVAVFFLIFDLEGAYIFAWAISCDSLGWSGWLQITFFIFVLLLGLVYLWQRGGLEWGSQAKPR